MTLNSCFCRNTQQALAKSNQSEEASIETIPIPSTANVLSQVPASAPALALYTQEDLQRITKFCMDSFFLKNYQEGPRESQLKTQFLNLYYEKSYIEYYRFCQQCNDYFDIASTT